ncbi:asparaginase [Gracilibacillus alcaliphilus]|uniref:asparaginase n=1 Tax=Gracilibacillus alcaliphilus TaxID=1401441 RepID=UPI00195ECD26|nr:asparaginase [Gracilibacillus alcaliphilus]MBM7676296.1 L-asparaginase II [Gracilibacillus alcaliphilus]
MSYPIIAIEERNHQLENTHQGIICVLDQHQQVVYQKGDIEQFVYYRSAMKPIQAIPAFSSSIIETYQLTKEEAALLTASQRGESYHQDALIRLADKLGISEDYLVCHPSYPLNEEPKLAYVTAQKPKRRLLHNCAGKHLGLLAYARENGLPMDSYASISHPVQQLILERLAELAEIDKAQIVSGTDGCGLPIHAIPLRNMAISYLKFADPFLIEENRLRETVTTIGEVMQAHPEIVASHDFICTVLLEDPNIIAKGGAQGVYCLALKQEKISIALKVLSGTEHLWPLLVAKLLEKLNYSNQTTIDKLYQLRPEQILNDNGKEAGQIKIDL